MSESNAFSGVGDGRDWARRIIAKHAEGEAVSSYALAMAREVLHMAPPPVPRRDRIAARPQQRPVAKTLPDHLQPY